MDFTFPVHLQQKYQVHQHNLFTIKKVCNKTSCKTQFLYTFEFYVVKNASFQQIAVIELHSEIN